MEKECDCEVTGENCKEVERLRQDLERTQLLLQESEQKRISLQEDLDKCNHSYKTEINLLKHQLFVYEEDFLKVNAELEAAKEELSRVKEELNVTRNLAAYSRANPSLEQLRHQREEALNRYRQQYEQRHPASQSAYQTDSYNFDSDGEDEIDGPC